MCTHYILTVTVRRRSVTDRQDRRQAAVTSPPFIYLAASVRHEHWLTPGRFAVAGSPPRDRPGKTNEGAGCGWASFRLAPPTRRGCHCHASLSLLHTSSWRGGQERGDLTLSPGGKSASGARREKSLGRKRNQRRRANYHFACSARRLPRHHVLALFFSESNRHHSILATEHPAARSIERTCICLYTVSIFIRAVLFAGPYVTWRAVA